MKKFLTVFAIALLFAGLVIGCGSSGGSSGDPAYPGDPGNSVPDTTPPLIDYTVPSNGATNVALNRNITATFDEEMRSSSLGATTFKVTGPGSTPVAGVVTMAADNTTTLFTPSVNLGVGTLYTAVITTGVKDVEGNTMEKAFTWTFTTAPTEEAGVADGPAPVVLGLAGSHVILAKAGISTKGTTSITGDIGVSPAAHTYITGFSEVLDSSKQFSTSSLVNGKIYAADMAVPTPAQMTTAIGNIETAYTDAAGRAIPKQTEMGGGNIGGMAPVPGLYKWGTVVTIDANLTLSGGPNDVWIFQIGKQLVVSGGTEIVLTGGAQAKNIFWQVAEEVSLGPSSSFKGIILCQTKIVLELGATLDGRAFAQTAVTLNSNKVTQPAP